MIAAGTRSNRVTNPATDVVGFVGLGAMGRPMADGLLAANWTVIGYDPDTAARAAHIGAGGQIAESVTAVLAGSSIVVTSLPSFEALESVIREISQQRSTASVQLIIIETSTLTLREKQRAEAEAARACIDLLDCPMSGTSAQARNGDLVAYLSGDDDAAVSAALPVLKAFTRAIHHVGPFGNGTRMKLIANLLVTIHNLAAAEALLLADHAGLDLGTVITAVSDGAGSSRMLEIRGPMMAAGSYHDPTFRVALGQKDSAAIRSLAADLGVCTPLFTASTVFYDAAMAQGRAGQDTASVYAVLQQLCSPAYLGH